MAVISHPEQHQIVAIHCFAMLGGEKVERIFVLLRGERRIDLTPQTHNRLFWNRLRNKERFTRHSVIALLIVRRNATFIAEGESDIFPRQVACDSAELGVDRTRSINAGKSDPEFAS